MFAPGVSIMSAGIADDTASRTMSGTSMSAPHVAGAAALHLGAAPASTPAQVTVALLAAATPDVVHDARSDNDGLLFADPALRNAPASTEPAPAEPTEPAPEPKGKSGK